MIRLTAVEPLAGHRVRVTVEDGTVRDIDVGPEICIGPIFEPVRNDRAFFERVSLGPAGGGIAWPNGADIDAYVLLGEREASDPPPPADEVARLLTEGHSTPTES